MLIQIYRLKKYAKLLNNGTIYQKLKHSFNHLLMGGTVREKNYTHIYHFPGMLSSILKFGWFILILDYRSHLTRVSIQKVVFCFFEVILNGQIILVISIILNLETRNKPHTPCIFTSLKGAKFYESTWYNHEDQRLCMQA